MQQDPKGILSKVLSIIGYTNNQDAFIDEFIKICQKQAFLDLLNSLPLEKQTTLTQETQPEKVQVLLNQYFTTEDINKSLTKATQTQFQSCLQTIDPTLSAEQRNNLDSFLTSLQPVS